MISQIKKIAKHIISIALYYSGASIMLTTIRRVLLKKDGPLILMYHRVIENDEKEEIQSGLYVEKYVFDAQIYYLKQNYHMIAMHEFIDGIYNNRRFPANTILITFDDGWMDNYANALPVLIKYGIPATIFLTVDFIESDNTFWFQELSKLLARNHSDMGKYPQIIIDILQDYPNSQSATDILVENIIELCKDRDKLIEKFKYLDSEIVKRIVFEMKKCNNLSKVDNVNKRLMLNWSEIGNMKDNNIEFGSHGLSHRLLTLLLREEIVEELSRSKQNIEERLGTSIYTFSYPNGDYNAEIKKLTEMTGYRCAFLAKNNINAVDKFEIGRIGIHNDTSTGMNGKFSKSMFAMHLLRNSW